MPKSVLMVEDDAACRWALAHVLRARGYAVHEAGSGQEALRWLREHSPPDVVILDWVLPDTEGWAFLQQIRRDSALAVLPVVVLSGFAERAGNSSRLAGVAYLEKPVSEEDLLAMLEQLTTSPQPEILIVEDEGGVSDVLGLALRHHGLAVRPARNGQEAVDIYRRYRQRIALVLMDVLMPGLDGPATLALLRRIDPRVPCCFMSGSTGPYSAEDLLALGAAGVLQKPFASLAQTAQSLWAVIQSRRSASKPDVPEAPEKSR